MSQKAEPHYLSAELRRKQGIMRTFAIDELRHITQNYASVSESFLQQFNLEELVMIHRCWMVSGFDIYPDKWLPLQVTEALRGIVPQWDDQEVPRFPSPRDYLTDWHKRAGT